MAATKETATAAGASAQHASGTRRTQSGRSTESVHVGLRRCDHEDQCFAVVRAVLDDFCSWLAGSRFRRDTRARR